MIASIHQPAYIPWLGYFDKVSKSDIHVFLDDAKYSKNNLFNRNKIKTPQGAAWLTVPVRYQSDLAINRIRIDNTSNWRKKHWLSIRGNYARSPFFRMYEQVFEEFYSKEREILADLTIELNKIIAGLLGIKVVFIKSSDLGVAGSKNEKLINICKTVGADVYLSGQGARPNYMKDDLFLAHGIEVRYQEFHPPIYQQLWGDFVANLSAIDFLFNCGKNKLIIEEISREKHT